MTRNAFLKTTTDLQHHLPVGFIKKLLVFEEVDSTNRVARELARTGAEEGTVIIAAQQNQGRGRFDRHWESPEGGVYLSLIVRPNIPFDKLSLLSLLSALATCTTLASYDIHPTIKWPNDVRVHKKKIAGLLLESEGEGSLVSYVVVGIGINLNTNLNRLTQEVLVHSTSLKQEINTLVNYQDFLLRFFHQFDVFYQLFLQKQYNQIISEWKKQSDTLGKQVQITMSTEVLQGIALDIDQSGFLILRTQQGDMIKITSGDCLYLNGL